MIKRLFVIAAIVAAAITASAIGDSPFPASGGGGTTLPSGSVAGQVLTATTDGGTLGWAAAASFSDADGGVSFNNKTAVRLGTNTSNARLLYTAEAASAGAGAYNDGVSSGDRSVGGAGTASPTGNQVKVTSSNYPAQYAQSLVDGNTGNNGGTDYAVDGNTNIAGFWIQWQYATAKILTEVTLLGRSTYNFGTWRIQRWDGAAWVNVGGTFAHTYVPSLTLVVTTASANTTAATIWRMLQVDGSFTSPNDSNNIYEMTFAIAPTITVPAMVSLSTTQSGTTTARGAFNGALYRLSPVVTSITDTGSFTLSFNTPVVRWTGSTTGTITEIAESGVDDGALVLLCNDDSADDLVVENDASNAVLAGGFNVTLNASRRCMWLIKNATVFTEVP